MLNHDVNRRAEILNLPDTNLDEDLTRFHGLDLERLNQLLDEHFISREGRQNCSPSTVEFRDFLEQWPEVEAHGYAVCARREDYRATIEGLECDLTTVVSERRSALRSAFHAFCRHADELEMEDDLLWSWWD
jgi:hypothetical protein